MRCRACSLFAAGFNAAQCMHHLMILYLRHESRAETLLDMTRNIYTGMKWILCGRLMAASLDLLSLSGKAASVPLHCTGIGNYKTPHTGRQSCCLSAVPAKRHAASFSHFSFRQQGVTCRWHQANLVHSVRSVCCFPSHCLLTPLMSPKNKKCKLVDDLKC